MNLLSIIFDKFSTKERKLFLGGIILVVLLLIFLVFLIIRDSGTFVSIPGGSYTEGIVGQPININPILSANPTDQEMSLLLYSRLSNLLQTWNASSDGKTYTLELKDGLKWSDGQPLTSDDVLFTINTVQNYNAHSPFYQSWQGVSAERVSSLQIKITLPNQNVFFMDNVDNLPVIPEHIYGSIPAENYSLSDYKLQPIGSGPYLFKSFAKRKDGFITSYELAANPFYAGTKPLIPTFSFKFFENTNEVTQALELHQINGYGSMWPTGIDTSLLKGFVVDTIPASDYYAVFFNPAVNPILKDPNIRAALTMSIDTNEIIDKVLSPEATPAAGPVLIPGIPAPTSTSSTSTAASLVSKYKSKNKNQPLTITLSVPDVQFLKNVAQIIQSDWESIGIDQVNIQTVDMSDPVNSPLKTRDYDALLFGNFLQNPEDLFPFWHSSQTTYPGLNLASYQSTKADNLMETIRETSDEGARQTLLANLQSTIMNDDPAAFLFSLPYLYIHSDDLRGFASGHVASPSDLYRDVSHWSIAEVQVIKP